MIVNKNIDRFYIFYFNIIFIKKNEKKIRYSI